MAGFNMMSRRVGLSAIAAFFIATCAFSTSARAQFGSKSDVQTEQVQATLLAHAPQGVPVGLTPEAASSQPVWVGLQIKHAPEWHTYWKNPGDSGLPTDLQWTLPPGVMAGDIAWPLPKKIPIGHLANYGYDGTVLLPVPLTITPEYKPSIAAMTEGMEIKLKANWLVCRQECIPQSGEFALKLPLRSSTALNGPAFEAALKSQPAPVQGSQRIELTHDGQRLAVRVAGLPASARGKTLELFAETPGVIVTAAKLAAAGQPVSPTTWSQRWEGDVWTADLPVSPERAESPAMMPLVLTTDDRQGWRTEALVSGTWPALAAAPGISPALEAALTANAQQAGTKALAPTSAVPLGTFVLGYFSDSLWWIGFILTLWCAYFFRDPQRVTPTDDRLVISPADGIISAVGPAYPPQELGLGDAEMLRISVFMNVFSVHVNRSPVRGKILQIAYRPGKFLNADLDKASAENERNGLRLASPNGEIGVVQIAGLVARRILCFSEEGQTIGAGERFGRAGARGVQSGGRPQHRVGGRPGVALGVVSGAQLPGADHMGVRLRARHGLVRGRGSDGLRRDRRPGQRDPGRAVH